MRYVVYGSGGFAKEVIGYLWSDGHQVEYVVSSEPFRTGARRYLELPVYSHDPQPGAWPALLAVSSPRLKRTLAVDGVEWRSYAHESAHVSCASSLGRGTIICAYSAILGDAKVGEFVTVNTRVFVAHDCFVGGYANLGPGTALCGGAYVGSDAEIYSAYLTPGAMVGYGARVGPQAVVRGELQDGAVLVAPRSMELPR